jgi:hypothetical protein
VSDHDSGDTPVLITEAAPSYEEQYAQRKRKYALIMSLRIPCLILAGVFVNIPWLALVLVALSIPLPWVAVLIANDRPPKKSEKVNRYRTVDSSRQLEAREHRVIDS